MEILNLVVTGIIICLAGMMQSMIGVGCALFAIPLLVLLGVPLPSAIVLVATCSTIQAGIGVHKLRASVPWRLSMIAAVIFIASVPVGLFMLTKLVTLDADSIRMVVGCILILLVAIQLFLKPHPVKKMHWSRAGLAFIISGIIGGLCGMGSATLVLWVMSHDWSTQKTRGFLFAIFVTVAPLQIVLMCLILGTSILWYVAIGIALLPLLYLGAAIGIPIGNRMSRAGLRSTAYIILLVIGVSAMLPALLTQLN